MHVVSHHIGGCTWMYSLLGFFKMCVWTVAAVVLLFPNALTATAGPMPCRQVELNDCVQR